MDGSYRRKPDLAAPGVFVRSAGLGSDVSTSLSGTSMASPHVAGAVALLWSAVPTLTGNIELTEQVLYKSATPVADGACEAGGAESVPNNTYGFGRLDAAAALEMAQRPGTLTVRAADSTGAPFAGVQVRAVDALTGYTVEGATGAGGDVTFTEVYSGTYRVDGSSPSATFAAAEAAVGLGEDVSATLAQVELPEKLYFPQIFSDVGADVIKTQ
jgi:subtilisin family serine protease